MDKVQHRVKYPVSRPMRKFRDVLLSAFIVSQIEQSLVYGDQQSTENVDYKEKELA